MMEITFARLNKLRIFEIETMSFINDMIHSLVRYHQMWQLSLVSGTSKQSQVHPK
jgi:hypothetical protein